MKFTFPILAAFLNAIPVLSEDGPYFDLKQNFTLTVVSNWDSGTVAGHDLRVLPADRVSVDGSWIQRIDEHIFKNSQSFWLFGVEREAWNKEYHYLCGLTMVSDPDTNVIHVILGGEDAAFDYKVNKFDKEVNLFCNRKEGIYDVGA